MGPNPMLTYPDLMRATIPPVKPLWRKSVHRVLIAERPRPSFAEVAKGGHAEPEALLAFLRSTYSDVSHRGAMPNLEPTGPQIDQISAYHESLRPEK